jgi:hypothetical protein
MTEEKWKGEGNYRAAREYDEGATAHARDKNKVKAEAEAAKKAMEGPERGALEAAEEEGKRHAKR